MDRLRYSISDIPNFLKARSLAAKADAALDQAKFQEVIASHASEGYDSYKYFDKQLWLRTKMMRVVELGLSERGRSCKLPRSRIGCSMDAVYSCVGRNRMVV